LLCGCHRCALRQKDDQKRDRRIGKNS
jgi:hypothetical protein